MNVRPEERPKLIALVAAIGVVVVYFCVVVIPRLMGQKHPPTPVTAAVASAVQSSAMAVPVVPVSTGASPSSTIWNLEQKMNEGAQAVAPRDPFMPLQPVATGVHISPWGPPPKVLPAATPPATAKAPPNPATPAAPTGAQGGTPATAQAATTSPIQSASIELNGVITDRPAMAVFRIGDRTYNKHEGDHLPQSLLIMHITEAGVQLRRGKTPIPFLAVGQTLPGSQGSSNHTEGSNANPAPAPAPAPTSTPVAQEVVDPRLLTVGTPAPDFAAITPDGKTVHLSDLKGKPIIIDFWATWCGPCQRSMPHLQKVYEQVRNKGVHVLAVCVWDRRPEYDKWVIAKKGTYTFPTAFDPAGRGDDSIAGRLYGVSGVPTQYVIDKDGNVAAVSVGFDPSGTRLEEALSKLGVEVKAL